MHTIIESCHLLLHKMPDAFAYNRLIFDDAGKPTDYELIYVNHAFKEMLGLTSDGITGKKVAVLLPGIHERIFNWVGTSGEKTFMIPLRKPYRITK